MTSTVSRSLAGGIVDTDDAIGGNRPEVRAVGGIDNTEQTFVRPADTTAYASGDLVANSATAGSVVPLQLPLARNAAGSGIVRGATLRKTGTSITNANFRAHLYRSAPTPSNGDNGAWLTNKAADYIGSIDITVDKVFTDGASGQSLQTEFDVKLASGTVLYALLEARGAYTPISSETFGLSLATLQD